MSYCVHTDEEVGEVRLVNLKEYTQIPLVLVMEKNKDMHSIRTLATVAYLYDEVHDVVSVDDTNLLIFNTQQECMDAVKDGKADAVLCDGYLAEYQLSAEMRYYNTGPGGC